MRCYTVQVTKDITDLSAAAFLKDVGKKCPVTARLSTVVHERGCVQPTSQCPVECNALAANKCRSW